MRDNFRPNIRLTTNILMVIGTFLIAFNLAPIAKNAKLESLCFEYLEVDGQYSFQKGIDPQSETTKDYNKKFSQLAKKISSIANFPFVTHPKTKKKYPNTAASLEYCLRRIEGSNGFS